MRPSLDELSTLVHTIEGGGVTAAATRMRLAKSVVSKRLKQLEASLGVSLFRRSGRQLVPTDAGMLAYERARAVLPQVDALIDAVASRDGGLRGPIQVNAPLSFGIRYVSPAVSRFMRLHPELEIRLDLDDRHVDLARQGYDMAIRIGRLDDSGLKSRRIGESPRSLYASPAYLQQHAVPCQPDELSQHEGLAYGNVRSGHIWQFRHRRTGAIRSPGMPSRFVSNSGEVLLDAAIAGLGLAALPTFLADAAVRAGQLREIRLPDWEMAGDAIQAVYLQGLALPARIRAFVDFMAAALAEAPCPSTHA